MAKWIQPARLIANPEQYSEDQFRAALEDCRFRVERATNAGIRKGLAKIVRDLEAASANKTS